MSLTYCTHCGAKLTKETDTEYTCTSCERKSYDNPRGAVGLVIVEGQKMLLAIRAHDPAKGTVDVVGGFVDHSESPRAALKREAKEEADIDIEILDILDAYTHPYGDEVVSMPVIYIGRIVSGTPTPADDVAKLKWFDIANPPNNVAWEFMEDVFKKVQVWVKNNPGS